jgi:hypothetical protein
MAHAGGAIHPLRAGNLGGLLQAPPPVGGSPSFEVVSFEVDDGVVKYITSVVPTPTADERLEVGVRWSEVCAHIRHAVSRLRLGRTFGRVVAILWSYGSQLNACHRWTL